MALSINQIKVAQLMAKGAKDKDVWPKVEISEATFYRWKKQKAFQDCLSFFQEEELRKSAAIAAAAGDGDELERLPVRMKSKFAEQIKRMAINSCQLANALIERCISNSEELSPRMIPSLVKGGDRCDRMSAPGQRSNHRARGFIE